MDAQRKVTCFVTRGAGAQAELCVFWHELSGIQIPAGTVEDHENFEEGARREAFEETGLADLEFAGWLGTRTYELNDAWGVLRREVSLRVRPDASALPSKWKLGRNFNIAVVERRNGFARIVYAEQDLEDDGGLVLARLEGWVAVDDLYLRQKRRFCHFRAPEGSPDHWQTIENDTHELHLYWVPLTPKPDMLLKPCQLWLDEFYEQLLSGVSPL